MCDYSCHICQKKPFVFTKAMTDYSQFQSLQFVFNLHCSLFHILDDRSIIIIVFHLRASAWKHVFFGGWWWKSILYQEKQYCWSYIRHVYRCPADILFTPLVFQLTLVLYIPTKHWLTDWLIRTIPLWYLLVLN